MPMRSLAALAVVLLAACGPIEARIGTPATATGASDSGRLMDRPTRDVGAVPMPSGINCDRNAAGNAGNCTER